MMQAQKKSNVRPAMSVEVVEPGARTPRGRIRCEIGENVKFSTDDLETYCFANWEPLLYDALLVAAAVEFCDRTQRRSEMQWQREFELRIPVHDPDRWNDK